MTQALALYESARAALAQARSVDEVLAVRDQSERLRLYARQAKDRGLLSDAVEIHMRAERALGVMLTAAKAAGQISRGKPPANCSEEEQYPRIRLEDAGIDRKLSMRSQKAATISQRAFELMVERTRERIAAGGATIIDRAVTTEDKKQARAARERVLGACQQALPAKKYGVIVADPEWKHAPWSPGGMMKSADNHYPTTPTDDIAARDVASIAAPDCVLFLWAVVPMLPDALRVLAAWGFTYRSSAVWVKQRPGEQMGMGYWFRIDHELLLVGTRGTIPCPAPGTQWRSVISAPAVGHSIKPDCSLEMIEQYFPTLPKIELNRRGPPRPGWDAWGNESESHDPDTGELDVLGRAGERNGADAAAGGGTDLLDADHDAARGGLPRRADGVIEDIPDFLGAR